MQTQAYENKWLWAIITLTFLVKPSQCFQKNQRHPKHLFSLDSNVISNAGFIVQLGKFMT